MKYNITYSIGGTTPKSLYVLNQDLIQQYKDEYDPQIFLDILNENNIQIKSYENKQDDILNLFPTSKYKPVYHPFSEIETMINNSCDDFIERVDEGKETIMVIPINYEHNFQKSNFFFSLLYLKTLYNKGFIIKDVVLLIVDSDIACDYFIKKWLVDDNTSTYNILLTDDGSYSGNQMYDYIRELLRYDFYKNFINVLHICFPFCVNLCKELNKDELLLRDSYIKDIYTKYNEKKLTEPSYKIRKFAEKWKENQNTTDNINRYIIENIMNPRLLFGDCILFHTGVEKNFNRNLNSWFDHKIPDYMSFMPYNRLSSNSKVISDNKIREQINFKSPYKIIWKFRGEILSSSYDVKRATNLNNFILTKEKDITEPDKYDQEDDDKHSDKLLGQGKLTKYYRKIRDFLNNV